MTDQGEQNMTKDKKMRLHRIFNIILAAFIILTGLCFMAGCLRIYFNVTFEGGLPVFHPYQEYSREIVADTFSKIAIPVYATILLAVLGFVYEFISPLSRKKEKVNKDYKNLAKRLSVKKNIESGEQDKETVSAIYKIKWKRTAKKWVLAAVWTVFSILFLAYATASKNYTDDINGSVLNAFLVLLSCIVIPFCYSVFFIYSTEKSYEKEVELLRKLPDAKEADIRSEEKKEQGNIVSVMRYIFIGAAIVALLIAGIYLGGYGDVLTKAVNLCTECVGLG